MSISDLFDLCEKKDIDGIVTFTTSESNKNVKLRTLQEGLASSKTKDVDSMWTELYSITTNAIMGLSEDEDANQLAFSLLDAVLLIANATLVNEKNLVPASLFETAVLLHGVLMTLPDEANLQKYEIAALLEKWWLRDIAGKDEVAVNTLHFFVNNALVVGKTNAAKVKRVWKIHDMVSLVNIESEELGSLKESLLECICARSFVREPEGRKFLSCLLNISAEFTEQLYSRFKERLPHSSKEACQLYGEVFFRAWNLASGPCLEKLENGCIQNLMHHAVHARRDSGCIMFSLISRVLQYFHKHNVQRSVNDMLLKLYKPILWRSLNVPNSDVRANAIYLLCDVFPLTCPVEKDAFINEQCSALQKALYDDSPVARRIAVEGVCRILSTYWEMLPNFTIKMFMTRLLQDQLNDGNSVEVRVCIIRGMSQLLDNHLCHPLLKIFLPTMQDHMHDCSETVRKAMMDLLLKTKTIRSIKFWTIVPIEHLLARLRLDSAPICKKIVKLLINSYMPLDLSPEEKITRLTSLIKEDAAAARRFFQYAHCELGLEETVNYLTLFSRLMIILIKRDQSERANKTADESNSSIVSNNKSISDVTTTADFDNNIDDDDSELSLKNRYVLIGIVEAMYIMWDSIASELHTPKYTQVRHELQKRYSICIPQMLKIFPEERAHDAIVLLAGFLPSTRLPSLSDTCMSKLRNMTSDNPMDTKHWHNLMFTMCKWRFSNSILEMIQNSVKAGLEERTIAEYKPGGSSVKRKSTKKCVMLKETIKPEPPIALRCLEILLEKDICRELLLANNMEALHSTLETLAPSVETVKSMCSDQMLLSNEEFVLKTFFLYLRLYLLLKKHEESDLLPLFSGLLTWAQDSLVPQLDTMDMASTHQRDLAFKTLQILLQMSCNLMMIGIADENFASQVLQITVTCLEADKRMSLLDNLLTCLQWVSNYSLVHEDLQPVVIQHMGGVFRHLAKYIIEHKQSCQEMLGSIKLQLSEILSLAMKFSATFKEKFLVTMILSMVAELVNAIRKEELPEPGGLTNLPPLSDLLLKSVLKPRVRLNFFLQQVEKFISSNTVPSLRHALACAHLINTISNSKGMLPLTQLSKCEESLATCVETLSKAADDEESTELLKEIKKRMEKEATEKPTDNSALV